MSRPWVLVPALSTLRAEFNEVWPGRDHASDGTVADAAHYAGGTSDHIPDEESSALAGKDGDDVNEVHGLDVDDDLDDDDPEAMERSVQIIVRRHRDGRDTRLQNVIYRRRIWSRSWGWTERPYTGSSPHTEHAHFSARYTDGAESDRRPWGLADAREDDFVDKATFFAWMNEWSQTAEGRHNLASAVATTDNVVNINDPDGKKDAGLQSLIRWGDVRATQARDNAAAAHERANEAVTIGERVEAKVDDVLAALAGAPGGDTGSSSSTKASAAKSAKSS